MFYSNVQHNCTKSIHFAGYFSFVMKVQCSFICSLRTAVCTAWAENIRSSFLFVVMLLHHTNDQHSTGITSGEW